MPPYTKISEILSLFNQILIRKLSKDAITNWENNYVSQTSFL